MQSDGYTGGGRHAKVMPPGHGVHHAAMHGTNEAELYKHTAQWSEDTLENKTGNVTADPFV